ncbi:hypothetical protein [Glutamicibacter sp.]|uniref:hypothetical protein n=1 Tax=Glutamicibacter sp. TaxID=1931995 RepID=UPI002FE04C6D
MELKLVSGGYATLMVLGLSWAVWAVMTAPDLDEIAGGWLGQDATVSSVPLVGQLPWLGIMLALAAYAIWQGVSRWKVAVHRKIRPWVLAMVLFNAIWVLCLRRELIGFSLIAGFILLAVLIRIVWVIDRSLLVQHVDRWITRACFGLFAGWLSMIIVAEALAFSAMHAGNPDSLMFKGTSALAVILLALFLSAISFKNPMGIYLNAGALWVLSCIIIDRYSGHAASPLFATVCLVAAVLMLICLVSALRTRIQRILSSH